MNHIKPKFHLAKRSPARSGGGHGAAPTAVVALVDERYLAWLGAQQPQPSQSPAPVLQRSALVPVFAHLARLCNPEAPLLRTCLFTDRPPTELIDDVLPRLVPQHALDGGLGLVRALGLELVQLAQRSPGAQVLLASDDERLIPYIDEAQWRGTKVILVTDEASHDFPKLMGDDPSWARLLMQADRRVSLNTAAWQALTVPGVGYYAARPTEAERPREAELPAAEADAALDLTDDWRAQVERVIQDWWTEETPHARLDLFEEMQNTQGVPPETDRHLLLRVRRELARTLSFPEKKAMREMIRATVMAQPPSVDEAVQP
ncbi:hypothetical protein [Macromonas nakdongensis]|uniref:hypothetical protein n=1 Tax=Macromonas nakdongensis TaxID=1843082 RepID=UPI000C31FE6F|nr:hypothetical protein [Macromonas nakdongensis]